MSNVNCVSKIAGLAFSAMLLSAAQVQAQDVVSMKSSDYTIPSWTKFSRVLASMQPSTTPYSINMTVNGDPSTRLGFAWFTNTSVSEGMVQIVAKADATADDFANPDMVVYANNVEVKGLNYSIEKNKLEGIEANTTRDYCSHKALVENLTPGTAYSYRVGNENGWSAIGHFTTAPAEKSEKYSFIYITDTQSQYDQMFDISQKTVHTAWNMVPDAAFVLCNGDLVETSGSSNSEWEYEQWFATMQDVWMDCPLVVAQGNHDKSSNSNFFHHFNTDTTYNAKAAVRTDMNGTVYSFVRGEVLYMVINYEDWNKEGYFESLAQWMREQVANHQDLKWRVASFHKNMFTGSRSHQDDADGKAVRQAMLPVFDELGINIALQGHDHIYEVLGPVNNIDKTLIADEVEHVEIVGEGNERENMTGKTGGVFNVNKGTLYFLNNSAGRKKYEPRNEQEMIDSYDKHEVNNYWGLFSGKFGQTGEPTFSKVDVTPDTITVTTYTVDSDGNASLFDSFKVINEKNPTSGISTSTDKDGQVKIYLSEQNKVMIEGVTPEEVAIYTIDGKQVVTGGFSTVSSIALPKGAYIIKASNATDAYYAKVQAK